MGCDHVPYKRRGRSLAAQHKAPLRSGDLRLPIDGGGALSEFCVVLSTGAERSAKAASSPTEVKK